ncbi:MAG: hypothetical protein FWC41_08695 [Firmicutes bacterium]|nr:hypothetical protein [Bacillota bacterium]
MKLQDVFKNFLDELYLKVKKQNFSKIIVSETETEFSNEKGKYIVALMDKNVTLTNSQGKLCEWYFCDELTKKEMDVILKDFYGIMNSKSQDNKKKDVTELDFWKLTDKILQIFPDLNENFRNESQEKNEFKKVHFIRNYVVPKVNDLLSKSRDKTKLKKLFEYLCHAYVFGDDVTRCIITMSIFNGINGIKERELAKTFLPMYMRKVWDASWKVR